MAKMTKKEYTRRRLFYGVLVFAAAALVITGVAIWLLFSTLGASSGGGVTVAEVAMSPLSFSSLMVDGEEVKSGETLQGAGFVFDSLEGDDSGRVSWNGVTSEKLSLTVSGILMGAQHLSRFTYVLTLPQGVIDAAEKGYLDISDFYDAEEGTFKEIALSLSDDGTLVTDGAETAFRFEFEIALRWGPRFGNMNPSVYFDTEGLGEPLEEVMGVLQDLRDTVFEGKDSRNFRPTYTLTLMASPNS